MDDFLFLVFLVDQTYSDSIGTRVKVGAKILYEWELVY